MVGVTSSRMPRAGWGSAASGAVLDGAIGIASGAPHGGRRSRAQAHRRRRLFRLLRWGASLGLPPGLLGTGEDVKDDEPGTQVHTPSVDTAADQEEVRFERLSEEAPSEEQYSVAPRS